MQTAQVRTRRNSAQMDELLQAATAAAQNAYAPYSGFRVGAAVLLESGEVVTGCNVENASYRLTSCAEQVAISRAVAEFGPAIRLQRVVVVNAHAGVACAPCGACRQTMAEFASPDCRISFPGDGGVTGECSLGDLLPACFTPESLKRAV